MKVTPLDIRKQSFKKVLRGADPEEVRMFLELIASEYEKVVQDNAMTAEKLSYQEERLEEYRQLERSLRNSLVTAERISAESREASDRESERILQDAQKRAERILEDSRERLQRLVQEVESLRNKKEVYVRRFRAMIEGQLSVLQENEQQFDEIETLEVSARDLLSRSSRPDEPVRRSAEIVSIRAAREREAPPEDEDAALRATARANEQRRREPDPAESFSVPRRAETPVAAHNGQRPRAEDGTDDSGFFEVRERREGFFEFAADEDESVPRRARK